MSITSKKINNVKNKVKAEMQRRNATEHSASMEEYSEESWDFAKENEAGDPVTDEHVQKIIDPLLKVNDFLYDNSFKSGKSGIELSIDKAEQFVDRLSQIDKSSSETGCRGNCTGLCKDACTGGCMGCEGCSGECSTSCGTSCGENCGGGCHGCSGGCYTGCTNTCGSGCTTSLKY